MVVYRVQDSEGRGPWRPGFSSRWVEDRPDHANLPPWMFEIGPVHRRALSGEHIGSACETLGQLQRWFTESEYRTLLGFGYRCVSIGGARILGRSNTQCVIACAKPLREIAATVDLYPQLQEAP